jgi:hypothetical protein
LTGRQRNVVDDARQKIFRWLVNTLKITLSMLTGAAMTIFASCTGIADVLQPFSAETPQEKPNEVSALGTEVARLKVLADNLECPVDYYVARKEVELLTVVMAQQQIDFNTQLDEFIAELNSEKMRADEADARAATAEEGLAKIRSLLQPAAPDAAQGDNE